MGFVKLFHQFKFLRLIAKKIAKNLTIQQRFYQGKICLNAVEHSWAWTGKNRYETFDRELQDKLYNASFTHNLLIDIGANIGVMTVGTLLHNPAIKAIAIDPNKLANQLLKKTIKLNQLESRCQVINHAVGKENGVIVFDETGSVTGHVSIRGRMVEQVKLSELLNQNHQQKTLVKIDVEGYETVLVEDFDAIINIKDYTFFIEVHQMGFNQIGNPKKVFDKLKELNATITDLNGKIITQLQPHLITQIIVTFGTC